MLKINENIHRLTMPYKDIFTTVYTIKTKVHPTIPPIAPSIVFFGLIFGHNL